MKPHAKGRGVSLPDDVWQAVGRRRRGAGLCAVSGMPSGWMPGRRTSCGIRRPPYWLAEIQDAGKVAHELGNSAGILLRHYRELVTREDAAAFWSLRPKQLT